MADHTVLYQTMKTNIDCAHACAIYFLWILLAVLCNFNAVTKVEMNEFSCLTVEHEI